MKLNSLRDRTYPLLCFYTLYVFILVSTVFDNALINTWMYQYLMEFNSLGDLMELSPLFSEDSRVAEAAAIAQKLRKYMACNMLTFSLFKLNFLKRIRSLH